MPKAPSIYQIISDPDGKPIFVSVPYASSQIINDIEGNPAYILIPCDHMPPLIPIDQDGADIVAEPSEPIPRILDGDDNDIPYPTEKAQYLDDDPPKYLNTNTVMGWREHFSMTEDQMARKMKIPLVAYRNIERSLYPQEKSLRKVADALGINRRMIRVF